MEEEQLVHQFDDWDWDDKGKRPLSEEEEEEEEAAVQAAGGASGSGDGAGSSGAAGEEEEEAAPQSPRGSEPGDLTCAICLGGIPLENMALVKGCDHMYCATCILHWALHKEEPWCPQCKQPFSYLLTYRSLDGGLNVSPVRDFPAEEPVCLLKRAPWFEEHLRFVDRGSASLVEESRLADQMAWQEYAGDYDLGEDEEIESFYFSSAAGRARVVLGNRRYGEGGFISGGRRQARPVVERKRSNKMGKAGEHAVVGTPPVPPAPANFRTPNAGGGRKARPGSAGTSSSTPVPFPTGAADFYGSSPGASGGAAIYGSSPSGSGRRARRNARRAAMDAGLEAAEGSWGSRG
ncbi:hypothetical protein CHLNCDRAFT_143887 [Chlorella variabilis]|uniref:RING-type domain-containing protein n=1 Tax=Chlorella variabilis TaxID=554065 RepID=E1ZAN7_CHLVA|nr:hypothetical protein CHLNCDRAFT_143887 [Chlorella variabilis]EFN57292.1 hypothetical protein CHLNCDRAFT_143887 [Chlorella variabilis]|eukprot:XP_005849394.1 hypothetical protein CHLNCDRAFT_143887 [Chlorella variabilis]